MKNVLGFVMVILSPAMLVGLIYLCSLLHNDVLTFAVGLPSFLAYMVVSVSLATTPN